jgi:predicted 2-oxoglutarate/Fe(II)-dependent dioxygenase YbiX/peroxiredoxin
MSAPAPGQTEPAGPPLAGELVPWFRAAALDGNPAYAFESTGGRAILVLFFGRAAEPASAAALSLVDASRNLFDDERACFFGVTVEPSDAAEGRIAQSLPGIRFFLDYDRALSRLYGAIPADDETRYLPHWLVIDPTLRLIDRFPIQAGEAALAALGAILAEPPATAFAPVLIAPRILEPAMCRKLIALYEAGGGEPSGFMRQVDGKTVLITDPAHKMRRDHTIEDEALRAQLALRVRRRLAPMVKRVFQFEPTRMERYLIGCYTAGAGHFRAHRDNTTAGTAHRRFAVTINLNAEDYEGGDLRFPEFGPRTYRAPTGGAVVFSCSLLHEATPVTKGTRYAFLPFLYDEAAAKLREANNPYLDESIGQYRAE